MSALDTVAVVEHATQGGVGLFNIEPGLMIWTWVVFGLVFLILSKFAWKPMMESVKAREKVLADAVENARKTKEELEKIAQQQQEMLRATQEQSRQILEQGRKTADVAAKEIIEKAQKESHNVLERAREQIESEKQRAITEIREQAVDLVLKTSEKLIAEVLDQDKHRTIVRKHLEEL
jgi:F-type H+-transporting ATPase subunit b